MLVWAGDPIALSIGPVVLRWYGLLFAGGAGTIIGARLGHCLIYEPDYFLAHPIEILKIWQGGLASHGGTVGVVLAFYLFIRFSRRYRFFDIADMLAVPIALVCTFIRIGNFMNSEILGKPTDSAIGIVFARLGEDFARYPAMLFEAAAYFIIFIILGVLYLKWHRRPEGFLLALLLFLIYTARFFIEPFKEEQADYSTGIALNVGQLLSIPFILGSLALMIFVTWYDRKRRAQSVGRVSTAPATEHKTSATPGEAKEQKPGAVKRKP